MSDILERLGTLANARGLAGAVEIEAYDEIKRLRAALREISEIGSSDTIDGHQAGESFATYDGGYSDGLCVQGRLARKALAANKANAT